MTFLLGFVAVATYQHRKILGETVRELRRKRGVSQERLAEQADLHHNYIGEIERGEKAATIDTLVKIAKALKIPPSDLLIDL